MKICFVTLILLLTEGFTTGSVIINPIDDVYLPACNQLYGLVSYPKIITNVTVLRTSPLRVRVHLLAQGPSKSIPFSVEGMVCQVGFDQNAANAACRSQNFNNAVLVPNIDWQAPAYGPGQECIMDTKSCKSVIPCEYIIHSLECPASTTNLAECRFPPLFTQSPLCNRHTHVGLICT
jgi:hypothetical protein